MVAIVVVVDAVVYEVEEHGDVMTVANGGVQSRATSAAGDGGAPDLSPALTSRHLQTAYMRSTTTRASEAWYHRR